MYSNHLLKRAYRTTLAKMRLHLLHTCTHLLPKTPLKPLSIFHKLYPIKKREYGFRTLPPVILSRQVHLAPPEKGTKLRVALLVVLKIKLRRQGILCDSYNPGRYDDMMCPKCGGGDSMERSFSLIIHEDGESASWSCFRAECGWKGHIQGPQGNKGYGGVYQSSKVQPKRVLTEESLELEPLCSELITFFARRKISGETLQRNGVMQRRYKDQVVIAFPYRRNGQLVSCKYREINKNFWQAFTLHATEKHAEKILYGVDDIKKASDIIIVEGEINKLSMEEAGYCNCVSVLDGAPPTVSEEKLLTSEEDTKYQYLWNCREYLEQASRIILATDADPPGQALAEELARRLGRERCWQVKWPKKNEVDYYKDANEVLMHLGPRTLTEVIEKAELYPIRGIFQFRDYFDEIDAYYNCSQGYELGVSTGWRAVNELYKVVPGELTVVSGVPNSGKSEWIDALLCNINESEGWSFALCSMENKVQEHARKLLEKHIRKPFFNAGYGASVERMSIEELEQGKKWLNNSFHLIRCEEDCLPSIKWILELSKTAILRHGVRGLVIDPYNELDHPRQSSLTETEFVSQMLSQIKHFAQHYACHVWFVAHPRQLHHRKPPTLYDISGSAHFINKCDNGIVIHRNQDPKAGPLDQVQICVRKVRNKVIGNIGDAFLSYSRITGEYKDIDEG